MDYDQPSAAVRGGWEALCKRKRPQVGRGCGHGPSGRLVGRQRQRAGHQAKERPGKGKSGGAGPIHTVARSD
eukprot:2134670-Alexandrium_andersonii.AAC.1